jgi:hypothetical protein
MHPETSAAGWATGGNYQGAVQSNTTGTANLHITLPVGAIVTSIVVWFELVGAGTAATAVMYDNVITTGVQTGPARTPVTSAAGAGYKSITLSEDLPFTLSDHWCRVLFTNSNNGDRLYGCAVTWYMP